MKSPPKSTECGRRNVNSVAKVRVVPDVNIYISGLLWTGLPHRLIHAAEIGTLGLVTTPSILEETQEVLARPKFRARMSALQTSVGELMTSLLSIVETIQEPKIIPVISQDPDDDKIVACAVAARVRWIISGDDHLLGLGRYKTIRIATPQQFWKRWGKRLIAEEPQ